MVCGPWWRKRERRKRPPRDGKRGVGGFVRTVRIRFCTRKPKAILQKKKIFKHKKGKKTFYFNPKNYIISLWPWTLIYRGLKKIEIVIFQNFEILWPFQRYSILLLNLWENSKNRRFQNKILHVENSLIRIHMILYGVILKNF